MIAQAKTPQKRKPQSSTKPSSLVQALLKQPLVNQLIVTPEPVAGSTPKTPAQQQDSGVPESSNDIMLNPEYHSYVDENGYNSLLGANVLDNSNGGNNSNASTESSSMGSSE